MNKYPLLSFPVANLDEAKAQQNQLCGLVRFEPLDVENVNEVIAIKAICTSEKALAVAAAVNLTDWRIVQIGFGEAPLNFPYQAGFFAYCAFAAIIQAVEQLNALRDVIIVEGHGIAHPRRFGLACHIGVALDLPCIGVAQTLLIGQHETLGEKKGSCAYLMDGNEIIGLAYRSQTGCKPLFFSVGNRINLASILGLAAKLFRAYRMPEPLRMAKFYLHNKIKKEY
ncbi:MAG: endonuclease V [Anaerolineales bacterium]